jgi:hypothetical protein
LTTASRLRTLCAFLIAISGGIHLRLYLDGYRDIHLDNFAGVDISRAFLLNALVAGGLAVFLIAFAATPRLATIGELAGIAYGAGALAAYAATRTVGLLGFEDSSWSTEARVAKFAELLLVILLTAALVISHRTPRRSESACAIPLGGAD